MPVFLEDDWSKIVTEVPAFEEGLWYGDDDEWFDIVRRGEEPSFDWSSFKPCADEVS